VLGSKWIAIALCVVFVLGAYVVWNRAIAGFNPNPATTSIVESTTSCAPSGACSGFRITSANLTVHTSEDIVSQILSLQFSTSGNVAMSDVHVFIDNISVGTVDGPFAPGVSRPVSLGISTTITITPGESYKVLVEGDFGKQQVVEYFQSIDVVAE